MWVHGNGASGRHWWRHQRAVPGPAAAPDLQGAGGRPPWPDPDQADVRADVDIVLASARELPGPVQLIGHSWGGTLVLRVAHQLPDARLIVHEPVLWSWIRRSAPATERAELDEVAAFLVDRRNAGREAWLERFVDFWHGSGSWRAMAPLRQAGMRRVAHKVFASVRDLIQRPDEGRLPPGRRAVVLLGEAAPAPVARALRAWSASEELPLVEVPGGHLAPWTHMDAWLEALQPWLLPADATSADGLPVD